MAILAPGTDRIDATSTFFLNKPPPGVTIIPVNDYQEIGIKKETSDGVERDGLGDPTMMLSKDRPTDFPKTNATNFTPAHLGGNVRNAKMKSGAMQAQWWEEWKRNENQLKQGGYSPQLNVLDRVRSAAYDFARNRTWPQDNNHVSGMSIRNLWDQFQLYIGLLQDMPIWKKKENEEDDGDDFSDEETRPSKGPEGGNRAKKPLKARPPYSNFDTKPTIVENDEQIQDLLQVADSRKNERLIEFCDHPERVITIFLSSYLIEQGLIYSERFLVEIPRLVRFFILYILNNDVLDGKRKELLRTIKLIDVALEELLLTSRIPKILPDDLNTALLNLFEIRPDVYWPDSEGFTVEEQPEPDAKRVKLDEEFTKQLQEQGVELIKADEIMEESNLEVDTMDVDSEVDNAENGAWGSSAAWGSGDATIETHDPWGADASADWAIGEAKSLMTLIGPTVLPLTHTPGVIEQSTRRIKQVIPPPTTPPTKSAVSTEPSADAVEAELEQRFTRVVLTPWDDPLVNFPVIHRLSKGPTLAAGEDLPTPSIGLRPHSPWKDDITILVDETAAQVLKKSIGMGVGGTFLQLARQSDFELAEKKKKKSKRGDTRLWYVSGVMSTLTSYHALVEEAPEPKPGF